MLSLYARFVTELNIQLLGIAFFVIAEALANIECEKEFAISTPRNMIVREATKSINQWRQVNSSSFEDFSQKVATLLLLCFSNTNSKHSTSAKHKKMWKTFSKIRNSHEMKHAWEALISTCNIGPLDPPLPQYVQEQQESSRLPFLLVSRNLPTSFLTVCFNSGRGECVAGYILHALRHKLEHSSHPFKEEFS